MDILCKLYLELANVVPSDCISSREKAMQKHIDRYGVALLKISKGCDDPQKVAKGVIERYSDDDGFGTDPL